MYLLLYLAFILFLRQVHAAEPTIEQFISYSRSSEDNVASSADPEWHNLVNNADSEHTSPPQPIIEEVPGVYIVELEKDASLLRRAEGQDSHTLFHREAQEQLTYSTRYEFKNEDSFYGLSLSLKNIEDLGKLKNLPQVRRIWPVESIPRPLSRYGSTAAPLRPRSKFQRRQSNGTLVFPEVNGPPIDSTIRMAGVDKLHEAGIKGKGMKIAVIDTGIDYHHPALGRGFGPGKKVSFGYAFVGDDYTGRPGSPRLPSDDPLTTCGEGGHGTHVAGKPCVLSLVLELAYPRYELC